MTWLDNKLILLARLFLFSEVSAQPCVMCIKRNMPHECHWPQEFTNGLASFPQKKSTAFHCCSVTKLCPTFCDPTDCSTPGLPVRHHFPDFAQTHVHWVGDTIQPCHPLSPPSRPALGLSMVEFKPVVMFSVYIWLCWKIKNLHDSEGEAHQWFWLKAELGVAIAHRPGQRSQQFLGDFCASPLLALAHHIMNPFKCGLRRRVKFYLPNLIFRALFQICKI